MNEYLMLLENPKSEVMRRAGELRSEGLDASDALSRAWSEIQELDDEDEEPTPRKRNPARTTFKPTALTTVLLVGGVGYLLWCFATKQQIGGAWSWKPWEEWRRRRQLFAQIEASKNNPAPGQGSPFIGGSHIISPAPDRTQETISIIDVF